MHILRYEKYRRRNIEILSPEIKKYDEIAGILGKKRV